jgi:hypothetical protein
VSVAARAQAWLDRTSDGVSPLVVKEVRQSVRGREFIVSFTASLLAGFAVASVGATMALAGSNSAGQWTFAALMGCLALLGLGVVPLGAFSRLRHEQADQTLELITLTALTSRRMMIGKLLAQNVRLLTFFAALAPFMAMSFLLGGIDLTTILIGLLLVYMGSVWVGAFCLFLSTLFRTRAASGLAFSGVGLLMIVLLITGVVLFQALIRGAVFPSAFGLGASGAARFKEFAILGTFWMTTLVNFVLLAENRLALASEDTVTPLRLGFFVQFVLLLLWGVVLWYTTYRPGTAPQLGAVAGIHLAAVAAFVLTEGLAVPRRVLQRMRTAPGAHRLLALFGPGAGRGATYVLVQMLLFAIAWAAFDPPGLAWRRLLATCGYICFFTAAPVLAFRHYAPARVTPLKLRVAVLCTVAAAMVLPDVLHYVILRPETLDLSYASRHLVNPWRTIAAWDQVEANAWTTVPGLMGLAGLLAYVQVIRLGAKATAHGPIGDDRAQTVEGETGRGGLIY